MRLLLLLCGCIPGPPHCPDLTYTPAGPAIASAEECPEEDCPLRCGDGKVCTRDDGLTCESCADLVTYMRVADGAPFLRDEDGVYEFGCWGR